MHAVNTINSEYHQLHIGKGAHHALAKYFDKSVSSVFILTDKNTEKYCLPIIKCVSERIDSAVLICISPGEEYKTLTTCELIWQYLLDHKADRHSLLINLGGGVISDLGGFAAGTFKRGIRYINLPTSLIGQIDASIGGKTGINYGNTKNQVGLYNFPEAVIIDTVFLKSLPEKEFLSGLAELIKYGLLYSVEFLNDIERIDNRDKLSDALVLSAANIKLDIILKDPYEKGLRKVLNFGHTIGHAIESYLLGNEMRISHGEAIAAGMICESYISTQVAGLHGNELEKITDVIKQRFDLFDIQTSAFEKILELMRFDKKNIADQIRIVLLKEIGSPIYDQPCEEELIKESLEYYSGR